MSNIPSKAGVKLFSEPPWIVQAVFIVSCHSFAAVLGDIFDFPSTKIVGDLVHELQRKIIHHPFFYKALKKKSF